MTEAQITAAVIAHWRSRGLPKTLVASIPNQRAFGQPGLTKGLADLLVIAPSFVGFIELKTAKGKLSQAQKDFQYLCIVNGIPHSVCYGRDEPIEILKHWKIVK